MKHLITILLILHFAIGISQAQNEENKYLDSLLIQLKLHSTQDTDRVILLTDIASQSSMSTDSEKIISYGKEALKISLKIDYPAGQGMAYNILAGHYINEKNYEKVVENCLNALKSFEKATYHNEINTSYKLLATAYKNLHEFDKAIDIYLQTEKNIRDMPLSMSHLSLYYNLADTYMNNYEPEIAIEWGEKLLAGAKEINSEIAQSMGYVTLAKLYSPRKLDPQKSLEYGYKALSMIDSTTQIKRFNYTKHLIANTYFSLKNYRKSEDIFLDLIKYNDTINDFENNSRFYKTLFRMYLEMGEDDKSFEASKLSNDYLVKSEEKKNQNIIKELEVQYETNKIKREKVLAEEKAVMNRNLFLAALASLFLLLIAAYFYNKQQQLKKEAELVGLELKETKNKLALERKLRDSELKALRAQMNPHFLFNAFNSIQEYIILNKRELASDYLGKFADLMRIYLNHSKERSILLEDEIKAADLYLQLERIRFEEDLDFSITVDDNVNEVMTSLPPMLIQPFIENSLKHGLFHKKGEKRIDIKFSKDENNLLTCHVVDNGIGRKKSALINEKRLHKHESFATAATQNRIELLNVGREKDISFTIVDLLDDNENAAGTKVILKIPLS